MTVFRAEVGVDYLKQAGRVNLTWSEGGSVFPLSRPGNAVSLLSSFSHTLKSTITAPLKSPTTGILKSPMTGVSNRLITVVQLPVEIEQLRLLAFCCICGTERGALNRRSFLPGYEASRRLNISGSLSTLGLLAKGFDS